MALNTANDVCIGKLSIDISEIKTEIDDLNKWLGKIGANIDLEDILTKKISTALKSLVNEAKNAGEEAAKAIKAGTATGSGDNKNLRDAIKLWREYYNVMTQAESALQKNDRGRFDELRKEAEEIYKKASALREEKDVWEQVAAARRKYESAQSSTASKTHMKEEAEHAKEVSYYIKEATEAKKAEAKANEETARQTQKEIQERDKLNQMYRQMFDEIDARNSKALDDARAQELKKEQAELDKLIKLYQEYFEYKTRGANAGAAGNTYSEDMYTSMAHGIYEEIQEIIKLHPELKKVAEESDKVAAAQANWMNAINSNALKEANANTKEYEKGIVDYKNALITLLNEQAKFNQQVASGRLVQGTDQYTAAEEKIRHLQEAADQAGAKIDAAGRNAARGMQEVKTAVDNVRVSMGAMTDAENAEPLKQVEAAYKQLTKAIQDYNLAKKANNNEGMMYAQQQINSAMQTVGLVEQEINALNVDEETRRRILAVIEQCKIQQDAQQKGVIGTSQATGELESQVKGLVTRYLSLMAVIRTISSLMKNMTEYVSEYSDKMNEIQMITLKTDSEVAQLAETYRGIAKEMNVSSLDMADAAIYFTRQGLEAEEIEKRLKNVTMYAKAANVEFKDASEIITAVVNSMGLVEQEAEDGRNAAQRVSDVFLQIGDHAATSGQEIGEAMQKAAASAGAFGVSMEWLASYIATVSETTRQEARTIGTAFNTIIARLHQIKSTGYNQEDETKVNDIAKALSKIDVVLMDQEGNWRDMETILIEVASKWDNLDDKTKSYIATTMAGVKQQNVFLALMNDMAKGAEHGSRAFELYNLAMDSTGVAADKYSVYLDSVTAAQERLTIAQEEFYSILGQDVIKGWYNTLTNIINGITDATDKMNGFNIVVPIAIGTISLLVIAFTKLTASVTAAGGALAFIGSHPVIMAISAVVVGITALTIAGSKLSDTTEEMKKRFTAASEAFTDSKGRLNSYLNIQNQLKEMIADVGTEVPMTSEKLNEYSELLDTIKSLSPETAEAVEKLRSGFGDQAAAVQTLNEKLDEAIKKEQQFSTMALINKYSDWMPSAEDGSMSFLGRLSNWVGDYSLNNANADTFAKGLQFYYENDVQVAKKYGRDLSNGTNHFTKDVIDEIDKLVAQYTSKHEDTDWGYIGSVIWSKFVGNGTIGELSSTLQQYAEEAIQDVMSTVGATMNEVDRNTLEKKLAEYIMGSDMKLDAQEYRDMGANISKFLSELLSGGFDFVTIDPTGSIQYIGEQFLGSYFSILFGDQFEDLKNDPEFAEIAKNISDAVSQLLAEGFSNTDIASVLEGLDLRQWENAVEAMRQKLLNEIKKNAGVEGLGISVIDMITGEETYDPGMWDDIDNATLKLINDMIIAGVEFDKIQTAMDQSESVDELKKKLEELGVQFDDTGDAAVKSMKDLAKQMKTSISDIQAIDTAITKLKESKDIDYSDMLGIAEAHPELLTVIGDEELLLEKLQEIREEASQNQRGILRDMILGTDITKTDYAQYASDQIKTLKDYMDSITDPEELNELNAALEAAIDIWQKVNDYTKEDAKEAKEATKEAAKSFSDAVKEVEKFDKVINKIESNKQIDFSDIVDLSDAHPEIVAFASDSEKLLEILKKLKSEAKETVRLKVQESVLDSEEWMKNSKYSGSGYKTVREYMGSLTNDTDYAEVEAEVKQATDNVVGLTDAFVDAEKELKETNKQFQATIKEVETLDKTIAKLQDNEKIDFSDILGLAEAHPWIMNFISDTDQMIAALERLKEMKMGEAMINLENAMLTDNKFFQESEFFNPDYSNLQEYLDALEKSGGDWQSVLEAMRGIAREMIDGAAASSTAAETWLDAQMKVAEINDEVNWAKANHFQDQIRMLEEANAAGGIQAAIDLFDSWDDKMQQAVGTEYPAFILQMVKARKAMDDQGKETADLTKETEGLSSALKTASKMNSVKYFTDSAKAIKQLSEGTISATDAYDTFNKEVNKVSKAYEDILDVQAKLEYNAKEINKDNQQKIDAADVSNLASLLGMTTDQILQDFPGAVEMFDELTGGAGELMQMFDALNEAAFIRITGVSEVDFSNLENGLFAIRSDAEDVIKALEATGQWEVTTVQLPQSAQVWDPFKKTWLASSAVANATVLKPTNNNPFARQSTVNKKADTKQKTGRSGGGGGGSSKDKNDNFRDTNTTTEVEKMLDLMSQVNTIQGSQQNWYQSQQKYYSQTGKLQGVISYMQKEKDVLAEQNVTLEGNIKRIEEYMEKKRAELAALSTTDESYKEVADDLDKLQKAHQTYSKQLIDNKTAMEALTESMDEQRKKIRQMEIDLRKTILDAIMDREEKRKNMLSAEIEMENTILELIKKKYETERDEIISTTDLKIESLKSERDLLDEQLRIRKEQAEAEDKALKLRELEAKYQRIIADPTRAKEAQSIKTEIDNLRKEMAWDLAENEIKSQQESIDQQIESLEDYKEYIENYYEDLFEHPQKLIAEMREIIMGTQEEIIQWLKDNDEAYRESSENTQEQMVEGWNETYENMKGILKDYWEEVEFIITQGDDYIIEFLKNNSVEYAKAGKLQAEAYVDEWKKQLSDLHKAYEAVASEMAVSYDTIKQYNGSSSGSSSSSSSGGGSGGGGGSSKTTTTTANMTTSAGGSHYYEFSAFGKNYSADKNSSGQYFANRGDAYAAAEAKIDALYQSQKATLDRNGANAYGYNQLAQAYKTAKNSIRAYKMGGIADFTGPAWVDGSPQDPERILTPYQNKLFETFVNTLEKMATITIPSMPSFDGLQSTGANPVSVGDIIVNVDNLDTEDDYETMAEKVGEILMERIGRSAVIGGLRIRSV